MDHWGIPFWNRDSSNRMWNHGKPLPKWSKSRKIKWDF